MTVLPSRALVSRRLKAARWLRSDALGVRGQVAPLPVEELARREALVRNRITANRLMEIEQCKTDVRPFELSAICAALEMPDDWFAADITGLLAQRDASDAAALAELVHGTFDQVTTNAGLLHELLSRHTLDSQRRIEQATQEVLDAVAAIADTRTRWAVAMNTRVGEIIQRLDRIEQAQARQVAGAALPAPAGELGHRAEGSQPSAPGRRRPRNPAVGGD